MAAAIHWNFHLRVTPKCTMEQVLARFQEHLGYVFTIEESYEHATDPQIVVARGSHGVPAESFADAVLATLNTAARINRWWEVAGPDTGPPELHSLTGLSVGSSTHVDGVPYAGYDLHYYEPGFDIHSWD